MRGLSKNSGFTLIELMVSLAIFAFMTAFLLAKYGTFNQSTLVTNLAYDAALTIRSAQSYGLNVQNAVNSQGTNLTCSGQTGYTSGNACFYYAYGVHFGGTTPTNRFILFVDLNTGQSNSGVYVPNDSPNVEDISTYKMNTGYTIQGICAIQAGSSACTPLSSLDITFKRPNPDAIIDGTLLSDGTTKITNAPYAKITFVANNTTSSVVVQSTGEISVGN